VFYYSSLTELYIAINGLHLSKQIIHLSGVVKVSKHPMNQEILDHMILINCYQNSRILIKHLSSYDNISLIVVFTG